MQGIWAGLLVLLTTYSPAKGYGNLYSDLLDYIISAALLFYILTIAAVVVLRYKRPDAERLYRTPGYPVVPAIYVLGRQHGRALSFHRPSGYDLAWAGAGDRWSSGVLVDPP